MPANTAWTELAATVAPFLRSAPYALAALMMIGPALNTLRSVIYDVLRWRSDRPRRERDQHANQLLERIGQDDPKTALELLARMPPPYDPFAQPTPPAEGPAPPMTPPASGAEP